MPNQIIKCKWLILMTQKSIPSSNHGIRIYKDVHNIHDIHIRTMAWRQLQLLAQHQQIAFQGSDKHQRMGIRIHHRRMGIQHTRSRAMAWLQPQLQLRALLQLLLQPLLPPVSPCCIDLETAAPVDVAVLLRRGIQASLARKCLAHIPEAAEGERLWATAVRAMALGNKAIRSRQEQGAVRALWAGGDWTRAKKFANGPATSRICRACGQANDDLSRR